MKTYKLSHIRIQYHALGFLWGGQEGDQKEIFSIWENKIVKMQFEKIRLSCTQLPSLEQQFQGQLGNTEGSVTTV